MGYLQNYKPTHTIALRFKNFHAECDTFCGVTTERDEL
jgi:hypothetical protein